MNICLFGLPKSGKTSILEVVFHRMGPVLTMMLDPTKKVEKISKDFGFSLPVNIHEFPGTFQPQDANPSEIALLENCKVILFVIDLQAEPYKNTYQNAIAYFVSLMRFALKVNPNLACSVFLHKSDAEVFNDEAARMDSLRSIAMVVDLFGLNLLAPIEYHFTTIYDHTIAEGLSKVVQKVIPNIFSISKLLDRLAATCKFEKTFLFEMISKTYIATDSSPVESQDYALCHDMVELVFDFTYSYNVNASKEGLKTDEKAGTTIKLANSTLLHYKQVNEYLALLCIARDSSFKESMLEYNIGVFRKGLAEIFEESKKDLKEC